MMRLKMRTNEYYIKFSDNNGIKIEVKVFASSAKEAIKFFIRDIDISEKSSFVISVTKIT